MSALATDVRGAGLAHLASAVACAVVLMMLVAQGYGHPLPIIIGAIAGVTVAAQRSAPATLFPPFRGRARDLPVIIRTRSPAAVRRSVLATIATLVVGVLVASTSVESLSLWPAAFSAVLAATHASAGIWALEELQVLGNLSRPLGELLRLVRDRLAGLTVGGDRARPGCLHVTTLAL